MFIQLIKNMFLDKIKESNKINLSDFSNLKGDKFYYSKTTALITLIFNAFVFILCLTIPLPVQYNDSYFITLPLSVLFFYRMMKAIGIYLFRNPILIIHNEELFYSKTNKWYLINEFDIEEIQDGKNNYFRSIQMREKNGQVLFTENKWYLKNTSEIHEAFKKAHLRRIVRLRNEKKSN